MDEENIFLSAIDYQENNPKNQKQTAMFVLELISGIIWLILMFVCALFAIASLSTTAVVNALDAEVNDVSYIETEKPAISQLTAVDGIFDMLDENGTVDPSDGGVQAEDTAGSIKTTLAKYDSIATTTLMFLFIFSIICAILYLFCGMRCLFRCKNWLKNPEIAIEDSYILHLIFGVVISVISIFSVKGLAILTICPIATNILGIIKHQNR